MFKTSVIVPVLIGTALLTATAADAQSRGRIRTPNGVAAIGRAHV